MFMSIYMVQHSFSKPEWLQEWNDWYANNLKVFMTIPGIFTAQRFQALHGSPPRFMAVYTVDPNVFESKIYLDNGGGGKASERFRPAYSVWIRNLFEGLGEVPAVALDQYLVIKDGADQTMHANDLEFQVLKTTGFHQTTPKRGIKVVAETQLSGLSQLEDLTIYRPITAQMKPH
jgi:hypothetical protein